MMDGQSVNRVRTSWKYQMPHVRLSFRDLEIQFPNPSDKKMWSVSELNFQL